MSAILLFWEDRTYHHALEQLLRRSGYDVIATNDADYALQVLRTIDVDLLMLDVESEEVPALRFLEAARTGLARETPAIAISEIDDEPVLSAARQLGVDEFLLKKKSLLPELLAHVDRHACPRPAWRPAAFLPASRLRYRPS